MQPTYGDEGVGEGICMGWSWQTLPQAPRWVGVHRDLLLQRPALTQASATMVLCSAPCFHDAVPHVLPMGTFCNGPVLAQFGFFI